MESLFSHEHRGEVKRPNKINRYYRRGRLIKWITYIHAIDDILM